MSNYIDKNEQKEIIERLTDDLVSFFEEIDGRKMEANEKAHVLALTREIARVGGSCHVATEKGRNDIDQGAEAGI